MGNDNALFIIDAHVHIYDCYDLSVFLKSAFSNCKQVAHRYGSESNHVPLLFLTEGRKERWFQRLKIYADSRKVIIGEGDARYTIFCTEEDFSLSIEPDHGCPLFLISGKQISTKERLEVLALGCGQSLPEGRSIEETVNSILDQGAMPVIPWGFGKWQGKRGRILEDFLTKCVDPSKVFLGDNGGRPSFLPTPIHFQIGHRKMIRILPGSDPLPFSSESSRPGTFGCTVAGSICRERPGEDIMNVLLDPETIPSPFGSLETPYRFMKNQVAMQFHKYRNRISSCE